MKLFNKTIDRQLFKQYALGSDLSKQEVVAKIFNPFGAGTWFILNSDPEDPDYLWAIVDLGYGAEVGSVSRTDLETYRGRFGMGFERDLSFDPINAEELYKGLRQGKYYADGGGVENKPYIFFFYDENGNEQIFKTLAEATKEAKQQGQQKVRDNLGEEYFVQYADGGGVERNITGLNSLGEKVKDVKGLFYWKSNEDGKIRITSGNGSVYFLEFDTLPEAEAYVEKVNAQTPNFFSSTYAKGGGVQGKDTWQNLFEEFGFKKGRSKYGLDVYSKRGYSATVDNKQRNVELLFDNDVLYSGFSIQGLHNALENQFGKRNFADGGGVNVGYNVFNYTDNIYATDEVFKTKALANKFIKEFRSRFSNQGYYRDNRMNKISIQDIDLLAIPSDFNPFKKFADGGSLTLSKYNNMVEFKAVPSKNYGGKNSLEILNKRNSSGYVVTDSKLELGSIDAGMAKSFFNKNFENGGQIEVVYERRADFKKKPIKLLLLNKGREQKGYTFSGKDQVAVLDNYNRNKQEDLEKLWNLKGYETKYADGGSLGNYDVVIDGDWDEPKKFKTFSLAKKWIYQNAKNYESLELVDPYGDTIFVEGNSTKEDLDWLFSNDEVSAFAKGGNIADFTDNQQMIMNQNVELEHHHEELEDILEDEMPVPAWVVAKMETATQNLSDITHYLDGQKQLMEDENEDVQIRSSEFVPVDEENEEEDDDQEAIKNQNVVEPINVSAGTKAELTKKFTDDAWGNLRGFLKGMEGIDLRDDYTFDYKDEQFEVEPIINSDENGVSNAVFSIFDGDGEEVGEVAYSRDGGKQKFTANSDYFQWNNAKFEDGGYFDGAIPNTSAYMSTYAKGGEVAKGEILGLKKNILGTTDVEMKITGMRKPQRFSVYPIGKDDTDKIITIQSETRIGKIDLSSGRGLMSQSHSNGAYFVHFQMDRLTPFTLNESDLEELKMHIFRTAGDKVGSRGIFSDNSGASRLFVNGGGIDVEHWLTINKEFGKPKWQSQESQDFNGVFNEVVDVYNRMLDSRDEPKITPQENKQIKELAQKFFKIKGFVTFNIVEGMANEIIKPRLKLVYYSNGGGIGFIPMDLEETLSILAKWGGTNIKGVIGILNAMIDSGVTNEDLIPKPTKYTSFQIEKATEKKIQEIWDKIKPNYKGNFEGNMYYSTLKEMISRNWIYKDVLVKFKPYRKYQKDSFADGGQVRTFDNSFGKTIIFKEEQIGKFTIGISSGFNNNRHVFIYEGEIGRYGAKGLPKDFTQSPQLSVEFANNFYSNLKRKVEYNQDLKPFQLIKDVKFLFADGGFMNDVYADGGELNNYTVTIVYPRLPLKGERSNWAYNENIDLDVLAKNETQAKKKALIKFSEMFPNEKPSITGVYSDKYNPFNFLSKTTRENGGFMSGVYAKGGNIKKYILKADIKTVTVKRNGKEVTYKGADVLNGAHVLAKGGDITSKANYVAKRDVVEVELNDGSKVKPVNGYWVKKGAEPITSKQEFTSKDLPKDGSEIKITAPKLGYFPEIDLILKYDSKNFRFDIYEDGVKKEIVGEKEVLNNLNNGIYVFSNKPTPTSSGNSDPKIGTTEIRKDMRGNWRAETTIDNFNGYDWRLSTIKTYSGNLVSSAQGGKTEATGSKGIKMFIYTMYQDPNHTLEVSKPKRITDKVVTEQHDKALAKFKKFMETGMFKGGGKISNFDKLSAKVAKQYEGKPVKSQYQEEYGKYYSKEEAQEVGDKVAGKVKAMQSDEKAFGGFFGGGLKSSAKKYPNLDDTIVTTKNGKTVFVISQTSDILLVIDANKIGTGVAPQKINISEIDPTSFKSGGKIEGKRENSGTETLKKANDLAKKIRKDGESWLDAKKRAFAQLKN